VNRLFLVDRYTPGLAFGPPFRKMEPAHLAEAKVRCLTGCEVPARGGASARRGAGRWPCSAPRSTGEAPAMCWAPAPAGPRCSARSALCVRHAHGARSFGSPIGKFPVGEHRSSNMNRCGGRPSAAPPLRPSPGLPGRQRRTPSHEVRAGEAPRQRVPGGFEPRRPPNVHGRGPGYLSGSGLERRGQGRHGKPHLPRGTREIQRTIAPHRGPRPVEARLLHELAARMRRGAAPPHPRTGGSTAERVLTYGEWERDAKPGGPTSPPSGLGARARHPPVGLWFDRSPPESVSAPL